MALSDPINVRLGAARRQKTLQKLAQQMASRAGGRAGGAGQFFRNNAALRGSARPALRLPFVLPDNRMRPGGFDPQPDDGTQWGAGPLSPVIEGGPSALGGGGTLGDASQTSLPVAPPGTFVNFNGAQVDVSGQTEFSPGNYNPNSPQGQYWINNPPQGDYPLNQAMPSAAPDPWTIFLSRLGIGGRNYQAM